MKKIILINTMVLLMIMSTTCFSGINLHILDGASRSTPSDDFGTAYTPKMGIAGGVALDIGLIASSIEIGALYTQRKFTVTATNTGVLASYAVFPALFNFWLLPDIFAVGGGVYYGQGVGNIKAGDADKSFDELMLKKYDIGALGTVKINIPAVDSVGIMAEGRASISIRNAATRGTFRYFDIIALIGTRWSL